MTIPRVDLPADAAARHAGGARRRCRRAQWGENSEALFLTSSFVQPDAATAARALRQRGRGVHLQPLLQPDGDDDSSAGWRRWKAPRLHRHRRAAWRAILHAVLGLLKSGDHVVCSRACSARRSSCSAGLRASSASRPASSRRPTSPQWRDAMRPNTKLLFAETPTNPLTEVCDIAALAEIAHARGALLAVDNCFCSPALQRPVELGADLSSIRAPSTSTGRAASSPAPSAGRAD